MLVMVTPSATVPISAAQNPRPLFSNPDIARFLLIVPALAFVLLFFLVPLSYILVKSFAGFSFQSYYLILQSPVYISVIIRTFLTCAFITFVTMLLAYPYAYLMSTSRGLVLLVLGAMVLLPFWMSLLVRSYSWLILLQNTGIINRALMSMGIVNHPIPLVRNLVGVSVGMTHILLPYAILPLYSVMSKIDPRYMEAASINGASPARAFFRVYFPMTMQGVTSAAVLVFTLGLGFYITPALLGGARDVMIGQLIASSVQMLLDLPFASALSVVLLVLTAAVFSVVALFGRLGRDRERGSP